MKTLARALSLAAVGALLAACSGTTVPYTFDGEPVCPDFSLGGAEPVRGGLKKPMHVAFKDGDATVAQVVLVGLRSADAPATPILLPDDDAAARRKRALLDHLDALAGIAWTPSSTRVVAAPSGVVDAAMTLGGRVGADEVVLVALAGSADVERLQLLVVDARTAP